MARNRDACSLYQFCSVATLIQTNIWTAINTDFDFSEVLFELLWDSKFVVIFLFTCNEIVSNDSLSLFYKIICQSLKSLSLYRLIGMKRNKNTRNVTCYVNESKQCLSRLFNINLRIMRNTSSFILISNVTISILIALFLSFCRVIIYGSTFPIICVV